MVTSLCRELKVLCGVKINLQARGMHTLLYAQEMASVLLGAFHFNRRDRCMAQNLDMLLAG